MEYSPILITVYHRVDHFKNCIKHLLQNPLASESVLYIASDAAAIKEHEAAVNEIREFASGVVGFKEVNLLFRDKNLGAAISGGEAIKVILLKYNSFIFLEDDIVVSQDFLQYMNNGLSYYREDKQCFSVCAFKLPFDLPTGYNKDIYFHPCNSPWGFATWKDRWEKVDYTYRDRYTELRKDKKKYKEFLSIGFFIKGILRADSRKEIEATDLRVYYHMFQHHMYAVFPVVSKSQNWGFDGSGEHCGNDKAWWTRPTLSASQLIEFEPFKEYDNNVVESQRKFYDRINGGLIAKYLKYTTLHDLYKKTKLIFMTTI